MTSERIRHVLAALLTVDGRGAAAKGELLLELLYACSDIPSLLYTNTDTPSLHAEIALAVAGSCLLCSSRIHVTRECPQRKVSKCTS